MSAKAHLVYAWVRNDDGQIVNWLCTCGTMGCDQVYGRTVHIDERHG